MLSFTQQPWLKTYIDFNTAKRMNARNDFEKDFFKLMNNSCFGKTMENLRKRRKIDLVTASKKLKKLAAQPSYKSCTIFHESLVAVERKDVIFPCFCTYLVRRETLLMFAGRKIHLIEFDCRELLLIVYEFEIH